MSIDWSKIEHFKRDEFGYAEGVEPDSDLVEMLDDARSVAGVPFKITSAIRTQEENDRIGGSPLSAHLTGHAVDIRVSDSSARFNILNGLISVGFRRIGVYDGHIHADNSPTLPEDVCWTGKSR